MASMNAKQEEKLKTEIIRLESELKTYKSACTMQEAYSRFFDDIKAEEANDPFSSAYTKPNPFHSAPGGSSGCCG